MQGTSGCVYIYKPSQTAMSTWNEAPTEAVIYIGGDATQVGPLWF